MWCRLRRQWQKWEVIRLVYQFSRLSDADQAHELEVVRLFERWQREHPGQKLSPAEADRLRGQAAERVSRAGDQP